MRDIFDDDEEFVDLDSVGSNRQLLAGPHRHGAAPGL